MDSQGMCTKKQQPFPTYILSENSKHSHVISHIFLSWPILLYPVPLPFCVLYPNSYPLSLFHSSGPRSDSGTFCQLSVTFFPQFSTLSVYITLHYCIRGMVLVLRRLTGMDKVHCSVLLQISSRGKNGHSYLFHGSG